MLKLLLLALMLAPLSDAFAADTGYTWNSGSPSKNQHVTAAREAIDAGDYGGALEKLYKAAEVKPKDADINNLLGYSYRKLGNKDRAFSYYQTALSIEPNHKGANAYLGELYLEVGDLAKAEQQLAVLSRVCASGCSEYTELESAITTFKSRTR